VTAVSGEGIAEHVGLVDHHVHGPFATDVTREAFELSLNEAATEAIPRWMTQFDSQLGFAIRRWCAPMLGLPAHASADEYWRRRSELGTDEVTARFLRAAGVTDWLVDTGLDPGRLVDPAGMAAKSGAHAHRIVRLEWVAEQLRAEGVSGREYAGRFQSRLAEETAQAIGVKTILAYRCGFDIDFGRPDATSVRIAASRWRDSADPRLRDPALLRFGLHAAVDLGLPIQVHTGFGDRDLDLFRCNPLLLLDFLRVAERAEVPVLLLHCYPYHREAGYLAQAFHNVYFDVGLGVNQLGVRSVELIAESFELAPFAKQLYSSDAWGPPELHYLGAVLWRRAIASTFGRWVDAGDWSAADAHRVVELVAWRNASRVYGLD
jgi:predicted TIM-barrel fold metal-dependent hydrolase